MHYSLDLNCQAAACIPSLYQIASRSLCVCVCVHQSFVIMNFNENDKCIILARHPSRAQNVTRPQHFRLAIPAAKVTVYSSRLPSLATIWHSRLIIALFTWQTGENTRGRKMNSPIHFYRENWKTRLARFVVAFDEGRWAVLSSASAEMITKNSNSLFLFNLEQQHLI